MAFKGIHVIKHNHDYLGTLKQDRMKEICVQFLEDSL